MQSFSKGFSAISFLVILAALGIIGGGVYYLWTESSHPEAIDRAISAVEQSPASVSATIAAAPTTGEFRSTLPRLLTRGDALECDWRMSGGNDAGPYNAGKLWTMGNQGRSQIQTTFNGVPMEANAIYKENTVYSWMKSSEVKVGYKFNQSQLDALTNQMTPQQRQQADQLREDMIFNCKAWSPDPSKFELPSGVTFNEI